MDHQNCISSKVIGNDVALIGGVSSSSNHQRSSELSTTKVTFGSTSNLGEITNKATSVVDVDALLMKGVFSSTSIQERPSVVTISKKSADIDVNMEKNHVHSRSVLMKLLMMLRLMT